MDPFAYLSLEALRQEIIAIIDDHLNSHPIVYREMTGGTIYLTVTETMWKGRPVISGDTGGIAVQLIHGYTGYAVNSPAGVAFYIKRLLNESERIDAIGHQAKEFVRNRFLLTRHVQDYLGIMIHLARGTA